MIDCSTLPLAVVHPHSTEEVAAVVRAAAGGGQQVDGLAELLTEGSGVLGRDVRHGRTRGQAGSPVHCEDIEAAWQENLEEGRPNADVFVVPCTLSPGAVSSSRGKTRLGTAPATAGTTTSPLAASMMSRCSASDSIFNVMGRPD